MSWITTKLLGIRQVLFGGAVLPQRGAINFVSGALVEDNPATGATDVSITSDTIFSEATFLATPGTIVRRSPGASARFGGTCHFVDIEATGNVAAGGNIAVTGNIAAGGNIAVAGSLAVVDTMSCHTGQIASELAVGGGMSCAVLEVATDIAAGGALYVTGAASCGALQAASVYTAGAMSGGALTVTGNITSTIGAISCPGSVTAGGASITGGATIGGLTTVASLTCSGTAAMGSLNCIGGAILGGATTASNFTMTSTNKVKLASRSITRTLSAPFIPFSSNYVPIYSGDVIVPSWFPESTGPAIGHFALSLPDGAVVTRVRVYIRPVPGHVGLPGYMPYVVLLYKTFPGSPLTGEVGFEASDSSPTVAAYHLPHAVTATGSLTIDRTTTMYTIGFRSEGGANALVGMLVEGADVTFTTTSLDDGYCV